MINIQEQLSIIPEVQMLCKSGKYEEAVELCDKIVIPKIRIKAILLCYEHEQLVKKGKE